MRVSKRAAILVAPLVALFSQLVVHGQEPELPPAAAGELNSASQPAGAVLTLAEAEERALVADRTIAEFGARAAASREQAIAARALPDPNLFLGLNAVPLDTFDLEQEPMTQVQVGLRQMFPRAGERGYRAGRFLAQADMQFARGDHQVRLIAREVGALWLELFYWLQAEAVVGDSETLFRQMVHIATSLYSQGKSNQADILRAELELRLLAERLLRIRQMQEQVRAKLTLWLDENTASRPLPPELPTLLPPPPLEELREGLSEHPRLRAKDAGVEAGQSGVELARSQFNTQWSLAVTYGHRPGKAPDGSDWADFISIGVTTDLPFFTDGLQERKLQASLRDLTAAQASRGDTLARLSRELNDDYARWSLLEDRLSLYDRDLLSLVADNSDASLQAYQNDVVDFATLVRARLTELETRLKWWRLRADLANAVVRLRYFQGDES